MFNTILWPVDRSPLAVEPIQGLIDLARMSNATVVVLSIAEPRLYRGTDAEALASGEAVEVAHLTTAKQEVGGIRRAVQQAGVACEDMVALSALPSAEIVNVARRRGCDLIVMATRGKLGIIDTLLNPSCTQEVIAASPVPVLVFP